MYLAKLQKGSKTCYQIRQTFQAGERPEEQSFNYRIVYELGTNPNRLIKIFEDHIILFDDDLIKAVSACTTNEVETILEQLLWDFLPKETRRRLSLFQPLNKQRSGPLTEEDHEAIARQVHVFDRRRLYYLRYGAVDQSRLSRMHEKCCRPLLGQSRDEREYYFITEENVLQPGNYLQYIYAIFNLQKNFTESFAPWLPESLARDEMADHFLKELCRLNSDRRFWQEEKPVDSLHRHLVRYLIMFFDYAPASRSFFEDFARQFRADHRKFRWPERRSNHSAEKISEIFTVSNEKLNSMTREQLNRLYRQKAMQLHPDLGGDHDLFIELTEIYNELLRSK